MPVVSSKEAPETLRPYLHHRVELKWASDSDAIGTCPFCDKERKFFVSQKTGQYDCKICGGGNAYTFIRKLHEASSATIPDLEEVAHDRKVLVETLQRWELVRSIIDQEWMLPAYGVKKEINNLYRWSMVGGKRRLLTTAALPHCMFGWQFWDDTKPEVYLLEGPWDNMALEEQLASYRIDEHEKCVPCSDVMRSILAKVNVLSVPGCEVFREDWATYIGAKHVTLMYDNDYPKKHPKSGKLLDPVGFAGMRKAARLLKPTAESLSIVAWGPNGYNTEYPDGYDIRDLLNNE